MATARTVLLTGSNRGIGLELVKQLLGSPRPPAWIFATCRDPDGPRAQVSAGREAAVTLGPCHRPEGLAAGAGLCCPLRALPRVKVT